MAEDTIDKLLNGAAPSDTQEVNIQGKLRGRVWNAVKRPIRTLLLVGAIGGAGLYLGVENSESIRMTVYDMEKSYKLSGAPDYKKLLDQFREANSLFEKYGEPGRSDAGKKMFCKELDRLPGYECKKL